MRELDVLAALLETQAARSEGLENCWRRTGELIVQLRRWQTGFARSYALSMLGGAALVAVVLVLVRL